MLQVNFIRENKEEIIRLLAIKRFNKFELLDQIIELDDQRKAIQKDLDEQLAESNRLAKEIGMLFKTGRGAEANEFKQKTADLKQSAKKLSDDLESIQAKLSELIVEIPNVPHPSVPEGKSDEDNVKVFEEGTIPELYDGAKPHWDLCKQFDIVDFDLGSKVTGAGFPFYKNQGS